MIITLILFVIVGLVDSLLSNCTGYEEVEIDGNCFKPFVSIYRNYSEAEIECNVNLDFFLQIQFIYTNIIQQDWGGGYLVIHFEELSQVENAADFSLTGLRCSWNGSGYSLIFPDGSPFEIDPSELDCSDQSRCYGYYLYEGGLSPIDCDDINNFVCEFQILVCGGILSSDVMNVCGGNGVCEMGDRCICNEGFSGLNCQRNDPKPSFVLETHTPCEESEFAVISASDVSGHQVRFKWSHLGEEYIYPSVKIMYSDLLNENVTFDVTAYDLWNRSSPTIRFDDSLLVLGTTINGYRYQEVTTTLEGSKSLRFRGSYDQSKSCVSVSSVTWSVDPPIPIFYLDQYNIFFENGVGDDLWPPSAMNYMINMTVSNETNGIKETAMVNLTVMHDELVLRVKKSSGNVPYDKPFRISVEEFYDPDQENTSYSFIWNCETDELPFRDFFLNISQTERIIIPIEPFLTYNVSVTYIVGERSKTVSLSFYTMNLTDSQISNVFYPSVFISSHKDGDPFYPGQEILLLGSVIYSHFENITDLRSLTTFWNSDSLDLSSSKLSLSLFSRYLRVKIPEDYESSTITFSFGVQPFGSNLNSSCTVTLDLDPLYFADGSVLMYPMTGSIFTTEFSIFFQDWEDDISLHDGKTIKYSLSYTDPCSREENIVFHGSTESINTFALSSDGTLNLTAIIYVDDSGFRITRVIQVEVNSTISFLTVKGVTEELNIYFRDRIEYTYSRSMLSSIQSVYTLVNLEDCDNNSCVTSCRTRNVREEEPNLYYTFQKNTAKYLYYGVQNDILVGEDVVMIMGIMSKFYIPNNLTLLIDHELYLNLIKELLESEELAPSLSLSGRGTLSFLIGKFEVGHPSPDPFEISRLYQKLVEWSLVDESMRFPDSTRCEGFDVDLGTTQINSNTGIVSTPIKIRTNQRYVIETEEEEEEGTNNDDDFTFFFNDGEDVMVSFYLSYLFDESTPGFTSLPDFNDILFVNTLSYTKYLISDQLNSTNQSCEVFSYVNGEPSEPSQIQVSFQVNPNIFPLESYFNQQQDTRKRRRSTTLLYNSNFTFTYSVICVQWNEEEEEEEECSETIVLNSTTVICLCEEPNTVYKVKLVSEKVSYFNVLEDSDDDDGEEEEDDDTVLYLVSAFSTLLLILIITSVLTLISILIYCCVCCVCIAVTFFSCGALVVCSCTGARKAKKVHPAEEEDEEEEFGENDRGLPSYVYIEKEEYELEEGEESDGEIYDEEDEEEEEEEEEEEGEEKEDLECVDGETFLSMKYGDIQKYVKTEGGEDDSSTFDSEEEDVEEEKENEMSPEEFARRQSENLKNIYEGAIVENKVEKFKEFKVGQIKTVKSAYEKARAKQKIIKKEMKILKRKPPPIENRGRWKN